MRVYTEAIGLCVGKLRCWHRTGRQENHSHPQRVRTPPGPEYPNLRCWLHIFLGLFVHRHIGNVSLRSLLHEGVLESPQEAPSTPRTNRIEGSAYMHTTPSPCRRNQMSTIPAVLFTHASFERTMIPTSATVGYFAPSKNNKKKRPSPATLPSPTNAVDRRRHHGHPSPQTTSNNTCRHVFIHGTHQYQPLLDVYRLSLIPRGGRLTSASDMRTTRTP